MKLTYISHACLQFEHDNIQVLTDPWFNGPAYLNQWFVFPKPINTDLTSQITHIILTHGHEDHLHIPTLKLMNKNVKIYFPYTWLSGTVKRLQLIGFTDIEEIPSFKKIKLSENFSFTFIINGLDAFVIYEYDNKVVINLNDALNASHWSFVEIFTKMIRKNWKTVDLLICGLGGASYFPNTVHAPKKDDKEIAILREQFLAHKFCEIMHEINPLYVMPFVPGFALLEKDKLWINKIRFPRSELQEYYRTHFEKPFPTVFIYPFPGDYVDDGVWYKISPYHQLAINDNLGHLVEEHYKKEIEELNTFQNIPAQLIYTFAEELNNILPLSRSGISEDLLEQVNFVIQLKDIEEQIFIHCFYEGGKLFTKVTNEIPPDANLKITTHSWKLDYALKELWGGDVFFIGYGADIYILDEKCLEDNIDIVSIRLLSRFPAASSVMKEEPIRAFKYLTGNTVFAKLAIKQKFYTRGNPNKLPYNERSHWVNKGKCDVCRLCDIPLLSDEFGEKISSEKNLFQA